MPGRHSNFPNIPGLDDELNRIIKRIENIGGTIVTKLPPLSQIEEKSQFLLKDGDSFTRYKKINGKLVDISASSGSSSGGGSSVAGVSSFNGRDGAVVSQSGDYDKNDIGLGNVTNDAQLKVAANLSDVNNQQTALDNITNVSVATNEDVLTKDTGTGNAIWKTSSGGGDMLKSTYDTDDDGIVDKAESVDDGTNSKTASEIKSHIDSTSNPHSVISSQVDTDTTNFDGNLSSADDTVQKALDTLDDLSVSGGVPAGGTTGQVLTKQSSSDFDSDWEDPAGGGLNFIIPNWEPYLRNWIKPETLVGNSSNTVVGDWNDESSYQSNYTPTNSPTIVKYAGFKAVGYDGTNQYHKSKTSTGQKVFWGKGATGSYTWIGLFKINSATTFDVLEMQYRLSTATNGLILMRTNSSDDTLFDILIRDDSGNSVQVSNIPVSELTSETILVWTYNNATKTLDIWVNGNHYTDSDASIDMSTNAETNDLDAVIGVWSDSSGVNTGRCLNFNLIERILFTEVKSSTKINGLCQYLMNKYNDQTLWTAL